MVPEAADFETVDRIIFAERFSSGHRAPGGKGVLLAGDQPNICADRRWVTFMRSFPNYIPLSGEEAERVMTVLRPLTFDRLYGWTPERVLRTDAKRSLERSLSRHLHALRGEHDVVAW